MQTQVRILQSEQTEGMSAGKVGAATEEFQYLMNFSTSITQCVARVGSFMQGVFLHLFFFRPRKNRFHPLLDKTG